MALLTVFLFLIFKVLWKVPIGESFDGNKQINNNQVDWNGCRNEKVVEAISINCSM